MMKKFLTVTAIAVAFSITACGTRETTKTTQPPQETTQETVHETMQETTQEIVEITTASTEGAVLQPLNLVKRSEKTNQITDEENWFQANQLSVPDWGDETRSCYPDSQTMIAVFEKNGDLTNIDCTAYLASQEGDKEFTDRSIRYAKIKDNVIYVEISHMTYADSAPDHAYILAIDLSDSHLIWQTQALIGNARNFLIIDDIIISGYGFTAEDDYLYQIDLKTGEVIGQTPVASKPEYIIEKDGLLYVRTYNTDYVFEIN